MPFKISMIIGNTPEAARLGQAIQAQVKEGGFDLQLVPTEFASSLTQTDKGDYQMFAIGWSGRVDPDGNISNFVTTLGSQNNNGYTNSDCGQVACPDADHNRCGREKGPLRPGDHAAAQGPTDHLPVPGEELHRRRLAPSWACRCTATA